MPADYTANWSPFPPETREVQGDEKWAFVGKKEQHCDAEDPQDQRQGDNWDHVAYDPEHRLALGVVPGKRTAEQAGLLLQDVKRRLRGTLRLRREDGSYQPRTPAMAAVLADHVWSLQEWLTYPCAQPP